MKRMIVAVTLLLIAAAVSGCIFSSDDGKDVKKGKVSGKITMTITGEPVANITVMLINRNAKIDTVNYANNRAAFVDSAVTGANGEFVLEGVAPGNYSVAPVNEDTTKVYKFTYAAGSDSSGIVMNGDAHTVDFIAEDTGYPGASGKGYDFTITVIQADAYVDGRTNYMFEFVKIYRRQWCGLVPEMRYMTNAWLQRKDGRQFFRINADMGFSGAVQIIEHYYEIRMQFCKVTVPFDWHTALFEEKSFTIGYPLDRTPKNSTWEYTIADDALVNTGAEWSVTNRPVLYGNKAHTTF